jgi:hypothetical protein
MVNPRQSAPSSGSIGSTYRFSLFLPVSFPFLTSSLLTLPFSFLLQFLLKSFFSFLSHLLLLLSLLEARLPLLLLPRMPVVVHVKSPALPSAALRRSRDSCCC